ncbi:hypothetical protein D3C72_946970 [compost metagenome]
MLVVEKGLPPTRSGWKLMTVRRSGSWMCLATRLYTERCEPSLIIWGTTLAMSVQRVKGTSESCSKPTA